MCWVMQVLHLDTTGIEGDAAMKFLESNNEKVIDALKAKVTERLCEARASYLYSVRNAEILIEERLNHMDQLLIEKQILNDENFVLEKNCLVISERMIVHLIKMHQV